MLSIGIILSGLFLHSSCEPPLCAWCYELHTLKVGRDIEICADNQADLDELVWLTEEMGYYCEYK